MNPVSPHVIDIELFTLGSLLLKDGAVIPEVSNILEPDDFYRPEHRTIYRAILKIFNNGISPNILTLVEELRTTKDEFGKPLLNGIGLEYLLHVAESAHTTAFAEHYARIIKDKSYLRQIDRIGEEMKQTAIEESTEPDQIAFDFANKLQNLIRISSTRSLSSKRFLKDNFLNEIQNRTQFNSRKTGFTNIDDFQIFSPGVYVIGATPACGKTTFVWQLAEQLAANGEKCIFCSYEMSALELTSKSIARELYRKFDSTLSSAEIRAGCFSSNIIEIIDKYNSDVEIIECSEESTDELLKLLTPYCRDASPVIFIDYLQIIPAKDNQDAKAKIDNAMRKFKVFQRKTNATFVIVSSFNRSNYSATVGFEGFKESGAIEYSADVVWAMQLYKLKELKDSAGVNRTREAVDEALKQQPREIEFKCLKNRQGSNYTVFFEYYSRHDWFSPCEEQDFKIEGPPETKSDSLEAI